MSMQCRYSIAVPMSRMISEASVDTWDKILLGFLHSINNHKNDIGGQSLEDINLDMFNIMKNYFSTNGALVFPGTCYKGSKET